MSKINSSEMVVIMAVNRMTVIQKSSIVTTTISDLRKASGLHHSTIRSALKTLEEKKVVIVEYGEDSVVNIEFNKNRT